MLDDLEAQQNLQDAGGRVLARRTIARQIELKHAVARGRFGEVWLGIFFKILVIKISSIHFEFLLWHSKNFLKPKLVTKMDLNSIFR